MAMELGWFCYLVRAKSLIQILVINLKNLIPRWWKRSQIFWPTSTKWRWNWDPRYLNFFFWFFGRSFLFVKMSEGFLKCYVRAGRVTLIYPRKRLRSEFFGCHFDWRPCSIGWWRNFGLWCFYALLCCRSQHQFLSFLQVQFLGFSRCFSHQWLSSINSTSRSLWCRDYNNKGAWTSSVLTHHSPK